MFVFQLQLVLYSCRVDLYILWILKWTDLCRGRGRTIVLQFKIKVHSGKISLFMQGDHNNYTDFCFVQMCIIQNSKDQGPGRYVPIWGQSGVASAWGQGGSGLETGLVMPSSFYQIGINQTNHKVCQITTWPGHNGPSRVGLRQKFGPDIFAEFYPRLAHHKYFSGQGPYKQLKYKPLTPCHIYSKT